MASVLYQKHCFNQSLTFYEGFGADVSLLVLAFTKLTKLTFLQGHKIRVIKCISKINYMTKGSTQNDANIINNYFNIRQILNRRAVRLFFFFCHFKENETCWGELKTFGAQNRDVNRSVHICKKKISHQPNLLYILLPASHHRSRGKWESSGLEHERHQCWVFSPEVWSHQCFEMEMRPEAALIVYFNAASVFIKRKTV